MDTVELPILVNGELVHGTDAEPHVIEYETGVRIRIPRVTPQVVQDVLKTSRLALAELHLDEITVFLNEVGRRWGDPDHAGRAEAVELASRITGYPRVMMASDYQRIARACDRAKLYDIVETDLQDPLLLDDWIPRQSVFLRAVPKGRVLHLMVGNVPLAGLFTIVRGLLTKNVTVAKLPKRDPVSTLAFARAFADVDPAHPLTRALSVLYWPGGDPVEQSFVDASNVVCAWGQRSSIESIKPKVPMGVDLLEFGPKESLMFIGGDQADWDAVALRAAYDLSVYEQEACFSPQRIFVEGDADLFAAKLAANLDTVLRRLPAGFAPIDKRAHIARARQEARFDGWRVRQSEGAEWTVVTLPDGEAPRLDHPLGRTAYVHPVRDLADAVREIHAETQTVSVYPWQRGMDLGERITLAGAGRVTEVGLMSRPRPGFVHDAMRPLHAMVRWVAVERGLDYRGRFRDASREEFERRIFGAPASDEP
ncbi:aldehyde dehydrogenase family protein [Actinophytocola sp.]|uniref:aldehyde dehydrogenase family protein n=1 Tax=Actinophytocola sp. TaxID=1872138 RepID=UPI00389B0828